MLAARLHAGSVRKSADSSIAHLRSSEHFVRLMSDHRGSRHPGVGWSRLSASHCRALLSHGTWHRPCVILEQALLCAAGSPSGTSKASALRHGVRRLSKRTIACLCEFVSDYDPGPAGDAARAARGCSTLRRLLEAAFVFFDPPNDQRQAAVPWLARASLNASACATAEEYHQVLAAKLCSAAQPPEGPVAQAPSRSCTRSGIKQFKGRC